MSFEQASGDNLDEPCFENATVNEAYCSACFQNTTVMQATCRAQELEQELSQRDAIAAANDASIQEWATPSIVLGVISMTLEIVLLTSVVWWRRRRVLQATGIGYMTSILIACVFGHIASMLDGAEPSGAVCRGRLALIYLYLFGMIAPISAKLFALCIVVHRQHYAEYAIAWDGRARRIMVGILLLQALILVFFLGLTARKPTREDRLLTVCSDAVSEHSFHFIDGFLAFLLLVAIFIMLAYLQMSSVAAVKRGLKEILLSAISLCLGAGCLLLLMTISNTARNVAVAVVPVRLLIILIVAWAVVGLQVLPPVVSMVGEFIQERMGVKYRRSRGMGEKATLKLVAVQQKQLLALEAEVVEKQRALRENMLRLKLMTTPMLQAWAEVTSEVLGGISGPSGPQAQHDRFYLSLFQNKNLVCWTDQVEATRHGPPAKVIDLFEVKEVAPPAVALPQLAPTRPAGGANTVQLHLKNEILTLRFTGHDQQRLAEKAQQWHAQLQDMLREISEPDPAPSFQDIRLWVGTWNMGNAPPNPEQLRQWLGVDEAVHDVYAVGLQEATFALTKEEKRLAGSLNSYIGEHLTNALGPEYCVVEAKSMWEIRLIVIAHEDILPHLELLDSASEATGLGGVGGNKGGVGIAISLHRTNICFITAHLAAHQDFVKKRNRDTVDIFKGLRTLAANKMPGTRQLDPTVAFDHVFFFGDLNYRVGATMETTLDVIEEQDQWTRLHAVDQLRQELSHGRCLAGFTETPPDFAPTFKRVKVKNTSATQGNARDSTYCNESRNSGTRNSTGDETPLPVKSGRYGIPRPSKESRRASPSVSTIKRVSMCPSIIQGMSKGLRSPMGRPEPADHTSPSPSRPDEREKLAADGAEEEASGALQAMGSSSGDTILLSGDTIREADDDEDEEDEDEDSSSSSTPAVPRRPPEPRGSSASTAVAGAFATGLGNSPRSSLPANISRQSSAESPRPVGKRADPMTQVREESSSHEEEEASSSTSGLLPEVVQAGRAFQLGYNPQRIPSWCDRVLWRSYPMCGCTQTGYLSVPAVDTSDHKPVWSTFAIRILLPENSEETVGDRHQWSLSVGALDVTVPLASLDDQDALVAAVDVPELLVEFCGNFIRTGYTTPPLTAQLVREGGQQLLAARFDSTVALPMTELSQKFGPQRIVHMHLIIQVVALFGGRRINLGTAVLSMDTALNMAGSEQERPLLSCGVDTGGFLKITPTLRDTAASRQELFGNVARGMRRSMQPPHKGVRFSRGTEGEDGHRPLCNVGRDSGLFGGRGGMWNRAKVATLNEFSEASDKPKMWGDLRARFGRAGSVKLLPRRAALATAPATARAPIHLELEATTSGKVRDDSPADDGEGAPAGQEIEEEIEGAPAACAKGHRRLQCISTFL